MPSYYDEKKKCRVGTMDEKQFYSESGAENEKFFRTLIAAWQERGGTLKWGAGGVGLRAPAAGKEIGICFLAPQYAGKKDRIELSLTALAKQVGDGRALKLKLALQKAAGDSFKGSSMVSIVEPGKLPAGAQAALVTTLAGKY